MKPSQNKPKIIQFEIVHRPDGHSWLYALDEHGAIKRRMVTVKEQSWDVIEGGV